MKIKTFFLDDLNNNMGDTLTRPILQHFGYKVELVGRKERGKVVGVGSIMTAVRSGDVVWGAGCIRQVPLQKTNVKFLAVRGPLTRSLISGSVVPEVYGDPALLLPLIYNPNISAKYDVGIIPHYIDKPVGHGTGYHFIDIQQDWKTVVREILRCKRIVSSSLHGLIVAEAYGIPATWIKLSDKIIGGTFKFHDYLRGTGREVQGYGDLPPIKDLQSIQDGLVNSAKQIGEHYDNV